MCEEKRSKICLIPARPHLFNPIVEGGKADRRKTVLGEATHNGESIRVCGQGFQFEG
ncbi:MAG: hypothetical protein IIB95_09230 [Candidatus Marinimicrobia bacterium]|nr:hypothetical protein [Candidatus Neomarinimicrobiota bacterium]